MQKLSIFLLFLFFALSTYAQNSITGVVSDAESGETLPGVNVHIKGTTNGTITDINGNYAINVSDSEVLVFSFVGYQEKEVIISNQTELNIALQVEALGLNEVVVVGYGTQKKSDLTGAISTVDMKELQSRQVSTIDQALQGQVAGVDVTTNSGTPGGGVMVRIRGIGTLNDANPLFVVDGMMVDDIDFLNTNDIESMQVLKDASATAIYGSRGANGVVIITTKNGSKNQEAKVSFNAYYGVQNFWRRAPICNSEQWATLNNEAQRAAGKPQHEGLENPAALRYTDWFNEISNVNAPIQNYDLSVSGGNEKNTYYLSGSYLDQEGIVDKSDFMRGSLRANGTHKPKKWLTIGENITLVKTAQNEVLEGDEWNNILISAMNMDPVSPVYNEDGTFAEGKYNDISNPAARLHYTNDTYTNYRTLANVYADIKFLKDFTFRTNYNMEYTFGTSDYYYPKFYVSPVFKNDNSTIGKYHDNLFISQWSNTLTYKKTINDTHNLTLLVGEETYSLRAEWDGITAKNVPTDDPDVRYIDNATGNTSAVTYGSANEEKQLSYLARLNYDFKGKYLLTANFRADASSKFSKKNQWGYFPSFSAGWRLTEENFLKDVDWLYNLKLRAGWGQIGNQGSVPSYQNVTTASTGMNYTWGGQFVPGSAFTSSGNDEIKWETSTTTNIGVDFGLMGGRISGTFEFFNKITSDMLLQVPVPGQAGLQEAPWQNAGEMKNSGIELSLNYSNRDNPFKYSFGLIMSHINNEVTSLGNGNEFIDGGSFRGNAYLTRTVVGKPIAQFYMYKTDGLFQNWDEVNSQSAQSGVAPGDIRYATTTNEAGEKELAYFFTGSPLPDFTYSFNMNFEYKGFDLTMNFQGVSGNEIFNAAAWYNRSSSAYWNLNVDMLNRWTGENSTNDAHYPRMNAMDSNNSLMSDRFIEDGSFLRFKTLQVGYTVPVKKHIDKLRFYFNAQNLFTFTKYSGLDPEVGTGYTGGLDIGIDRASYPQARLMSFGVNLIF